MAHQPEQSFRFLDLPPELRVMIYKEISIDTRTRHHTFHTLPKEDVIFSTAPKTAGAAITLVVKSLPTSLLATCRLINVEASPIMKPKIDKLRKEPMRFIIDSMSLPPLCINQRLFPYLVRKYQARIKDKNGRDDESELLGCLREDVRDLYPGLSTARVDSLSQLTLRWASSNHHRRPDTVMVAVIPLTGGSSASLKRSIVYAVLSRFPGTRLLPHGTRVEHFIHGEISQRLERAISSAVRYRRGTEWSNNDVSDVEWKEDWEETASVFK
jgi:hypothetical protein